MACAAHYPRRPDWKSGKMSRLILLAGAAATLMAFPAFANDYNQAGSARAAQDFGQDAAAVQTAQGPNVVASPPVPDTPENRARYGGPMSRAGRHTAAIGD